MSVPDRLNTFTETVKRLLLPFKGDFFELRLLHKINHLLLRAAAEGTSREKMIMSYSGTAGVG